MIEGHRDGDDELADLLAVFDEQVAAGSAPVDSPETICDVSPDTIARLENAKQCVHLLQKLWPRSIDQQFKRPSAIGRFKILRELGIGGFGTVFLADDPQLNRQVALKVPHFNWLLSTVGQQHFLREAEAAARLNHPSIIAVYEIGQAGSLTYIACEFCPGLSLDSWLAATRTSVPVREAAQLVAKLARAMHYAHSHGVLHRDLKPSNILLSGAPAESINPSLALCEFSPKIADFGLAKIVEDSNNQTRTGAILGTLAYLAPEQAEGRVRDISVQTDIYALGAILYELLTGLPPNRGNTEAETLRRILLVETASPKRLRSDIPTDLAAVCLKCLEKAPEGRYDTAADLAEDLERFCDGRPTIASPIGVTRRMWRWARRRPALAALSAFSMAAVLTLAAGAVVYDVKLKRAFDLVEREAAANRELLYTSNMRLAAESWQTGHVTQAADILARLAPTAEQSDLREFSCHSLWNVIHSEVYALKGHKEDVYHVAFSPNGKSLASAGLDQTFRLWDLSSGSLLQSFHGHRDEVNVVAFIQDNVVASASDDGTVCIWDTLTGQPTLSLEAHDGAVAALAISPNGRFLSSGGAGSQIHFWNPKSGALLWTSPKSTPVETLSFSPDSKTLVSGHKDGTTRWWSVDDRRLIQVENSFKDWPASVAFSTVFQLVAVAGRTGALQTYRRDDSGWREKASAELNTKAMGIYTVAFSPRNNMLATGSRDGLIELWNPGAKLTRCGELPGHDSRIWCVSWSPDGRLLASASADGTIKVWNVPRSARTVKLYPRLSAQICSIAVSPDSQSILTGTVDGRLHEWDRRTRHVREISDDHRKGFAGACYVGEQHLALGTGPQGGLRLFDLESRDAQMQPGNDLVSPCALAVSHDAPLLAIGCEHAKAYLFDAASGALRRRLEVQTLDVNCVALSRDARTLATAGVGPEIELWDAQTGQRKHVLPGYDFHVLSLTFSPDGTRLISGGSDHAIRVWEVSSGRQSATLLGQSGPIKTLAISPDGRTLASGSDNPPSLRMWDIRTNAPLRSLHDVPSSVHVLTFTPDGQALIASCGENEGQLAEWTSSDSIGMPATSDLRAPLRPIDKKRPEPASSDAPLESVDLFQAVNAYARRSGFMTGYPTFRKPEEGNHSTVEVVLLRGTGIKSAFVTLDDFHGSVDMPRADYDTPDALLSGVFSSVDRWSRESGFLGVIPTCFTRVTSDATSVYEIELLYGSRFSRPRIDLGDLDDLGDVKSTFRQVHAWATKAGYASAFPTFNVTRQELECVAIRAGSATVVEIPTSELIEPGR